MAKDSFSTALAWCNTPEGPSVNTSIMPLFFLSSHQNQKPNKLFVYKVSGFGILVEQRKVD